MLEYFIHEILPWLVFVHFIKFWLIKQLIVLQVKTFAFILIFIIKFILKCKRLWLIKLFILKNKWQCLQLIREKLSKNYCICFSLKDSNCWPTHLFWNLECPTCSQAQENSFSSQKHWPRIIWKNYTNAPG